ncbi:hypothetical protein [Pseudoduganella sp. GCM10020061]|uniref:hypothetical protein n=1 Tax=Pseudoduganella sp. GCM10020061 TaxID=3317345 RepID=UPI003636AA06
MRKYLAIFCGVSLLSVGSVAALNYVVDPYMIHQWDTPEVQRLRPPREKLSAWGKTYAVARYRPAVLYLGNSRTELALPAPHPAFGGAPSFNAALSGASLGDMVAMARHAMALGPVDTVVWGIDAPSFSLVLGTLDFDRELVASGGDYLPRRALLDVKRALTLDMTLDSVSLLRGSFGSVCRSNLAFNGQRDESCIVDHMQGWGGTAAAVRPRLAEFVRGEGPTAAALSSFDAALGALCSSGTRIRAYINPTHASMHVALHAAGKWQALERWQQRLAGIAARRRAAGCDLRLYDFSGFNSITAEPLPQASGAREMRYYWEPSHYRANVGRMLIQAMFGGDPQAQVPAGFGVELTPESIAIHQLAQRAARDSYIANNPVEAAIARSVAREESAKAARLKR